MTRKNLNAPMDYMGISMNWIKKVCGFLEK
jgi:hypothetical protein